MLERLPGPLSTELDRTLTLLQWFVRCGGVENAMSQVGIDWTGSPHSAVGRAGTKWDITQMDGGGYGITVADWDRPDWYADTLSDAQQLCNMMDRTPPFWNELMVTDWLPPLD